MRIMAMTAAAALLVGASGGAFAQSIACGGGYTIARGDTLRAIAIRAYGVGTYQLIYGANVDVIGPNPNLIEVGMRLSIPCRGDQAAPAQTGEGAPLAAVSLRTTPEAPAAAPSGAQFIGVDGNAPFSDDNLPGGGLFTELVVLAMQRAGGDAGEVDFAPDWPAQLSALAPGGGYDVGFPWVRPDCARPAGLGAESRARCRSFEFSDPFFEVVLSFYTIRGSEYENADSHEDLLGARLCRPDGMFVGDLEAEGLVEPNVSLVAPSTARDCFDALLVGEVNVVTMDALTAEKTLENVSGAARKVLELEGLATLQTLHAVAPRTSPSGRAALAQLNDGLRVMRGSGEWFSAVQKHQAE
jgi:polar amino acid transport system substrate-binding protein